MEGRHVDIDVDQIGLRCEIIDAWDEMVLHRSGR